MTMNNYTPAQWTLIDLANQYGLDKEEYPTRLAFGREMLEAIKEDTIEEWMDKAENPALFTKGVFAVRKILSGAPTNHVIGLDALNSGPQLLSVLLHCKTGMMNTGILPNPKTPRPDGYAIIRDNMHCDIEVNRKQVKNATVPYAYGSDAKPELIFGEELFGEFEKGYERTFPEAYWARKTLINAWNEKALSHEFTAIDGMEVYLENRAVDEFKGELHGYRFTYQTSVNRPLKKREKGAKSLVANVTHAGDAFIVRELDNRCNYNPNQVRRVIDIIDNHLDFGSDHENEEFLRLQECAKRFNFVSVANWENIQYGKLKGADPEYLCALRTKAVEALMYQSFETFSIHDEFKCGVNHVERLRYTYNNIMAELYQSTWLLDVIEDLTGERYEWEEPTDPEVVELIKQSNYAIN